MITCWRHNKRCFIEPSVTAPRAVANTMPPWKEYVNNNQEGRESMNDIEQNHHVHGEQNNESAQHTHAQHTHRFYWRRAHRDWRVWVAVLLMIACMIVYVMSEDLSLRPGGKLQPRMPAIVGE